ncbi:CAAX prenyl protease 2 [Carica papaya]|uniref:CAAX prenyl protease 2 n=1 Tax=Carica papaya TaxID=3649 RepID=UPI000B8CD188|nr:CAAX prenyl protease 2 [Carica papaya]
MEENREGRLSSPVAVIACVAMTFFYVTILYAPTLILRLPPPSSFKNFMIRRFVCAVISSIVSVIVSALILPVSHPFPYVTFPSHVDMVYEQAPITEELVFRACMIPILLCGGFRIYTAIFSCPVFFSLAHLNHFMEVYTRQNFSLLKATLVVGLQLGYTIVFGWYASFLFIRTGSHTQFYVNVKFIFLIISMSGLVTVAFIAGMAAFLWLLFPVTQPEFYNNRTHDCQCWKGYCSWN